MPARRFTLIALAAFALYLPASLYAPMGIDPAASDAGSPQLPCVNQHMLQARAWLGEPVTIHVAGQPTTIPIQPRLDITPYILAEQIAPNDRRNSLALADLAVIPGQPTQPAQSLGQTIQALPEHAPIVHHVGFPPGPSILLLPFRYLLGQHAAVQWIAPLFAALTIALADWLIGWWLRQTSPNAGSQPAPALRNLLTLLAAGGWQLGWLAVNPGVWHFAHICAILSLTAALAANARGWPLLAAVAWALAIASRPATLLAAPFLLIQTAHHIRQTAGSHLASTPARFALHTALLAVAPLIMLAAMLAHNAARFGSPFEFGYAHMQLADLPAERLAAHGQFSPHWIADNLYTFFIAPPVLHTETTPLGNAKPAWPWIISDPLGMGAVFFAPACLLALLALRPAPMKQPLVVAAWLSALLALFPALLYFNTGWVQWGARFLTDAWILWLLITARGAADLPHNARRYLLGWLVTLSLFSNAWAVYCTAAGGWPPRQTNPVIRVIEGGSVMQLD